MASYKNILVTTSSTLIGIDIKKYLNPVSAHVVAGTNIVSDFFASFSDVFGGRSESYQKQLTSLYNEAIEKLKLAAYENGANCIIGLRIDLDEISGKGKSMFMISALGTAVIIDEGVNIDVQISKIDKPTEISIEKIKNIRAQNFIIKSAYDNSLSLTEKNWDFIISNSIIEVFPFIVNQLRKYFETDSFAFHFENTTIFLDNLTDDKKEELIYSALMIEESDKLSIKLCEFIKNFNLVNFNYINTLLQSSEIKKQKIGLSLFSYDKSKYTKSDLLELNKFIDIIKTKFPELGTHTTKKALLSSNEKQVWVCPCKATNDLGTTCKSCFKDIYGFTNNEISPPKMIEIIEEKISLISECI